EGLVQRAALFADGERLHDERVLTDAILDLRELALLHERGELGRLLQRLGELRRVGDDDRALELAEGELAGRGASAGRGARGGSGSARRLGLRCAGRKDPCAARGGRELEEFPTTERALCHLRPSYPLWRDIASRRGSGSPPS